jgi:lipid A disaccharide synthetase
LDDHCLEEAELDDQMDPNVEVAELLAQQVLLPEQVQEQLQPQELVVLLEQLHLAELAQVQQVVQALQQVQPWQLVVQK